MYYSIDCKSNKNKLFCSVNLVFYILIKFLKQLGNYSVVLKDFAIDAEGLGLNSQAGQIRHSVANGSQLLRHFFGAALPRH